MFTATKAPNTSNLIWDAKNEKILCRFKKDKFETEDEEIARKLDSMGYSVAGLHEKEEIPDFDNMKVEELKLYANEKGIELGNATLKADIITAIKEYLKV